MNKRFGESPFLNSSGVGDGRGLGKYPEASLSFYLSTSEKF
jgi:hypothetical protein